MNGTSLIRNIAQLVAFPSEMGLHWDSSPSFYDCLKVISAVEGIETTRLVLALS
jgi:hypothetical protein